MSIDEGLHSQSEAVRSGPPRWRPPGMRSGPFGGRLQPAIARQRLVAPAITFTLIAILLVVGDITTPAFLTGSNIVVIVRAASITGIMALGMTFMTISGNFFSLSVEQTAAMSAIVFAEAMAHGWNLFAAIAATLVLAMAIGALQGAVIAVGANPIVTTLAAGAILYGLGSVITHNQIVQIRTGTGTWIGQGRPLSVPTQVWALILLTVIASIVLRKTRFGRLLTLVGANRQTARASGLGVRRATILALVLTAVGAGIAGIFVASQIRQGIVNQFTGSNIDVIAAVLVGGAAIQGGSGSTVMTALGAVFIALLQNFLLLRNYSFGVRTAAEGLLVVLAVSAVHVLRTRRNQ